MKTIRIGLLLAVGMTVAGCLTTPAYQLRDVTYQDVQQALVKGHTTKDQVRERFGRPTSINHFNGQEMWTYNLTQIDPLSVMVGAGTYRNLTITYRGDIVRDYTYNSGGQ